METSYYLLYKDSRGEIIKFPKVPISAVELLIGLDKGIYAAHSQKGIPLISPDVYGEERRLQPKDALEELKKQDNPSFNYLIEVLEKSTDILVIREQRDYSFSTPAGLASRRYERYENGESGPRH